MSKKIITIYLTLIIAVVSQSCSIVGLVQSHKKVNGDFELELKPKNSFGYYDMSINVVQGIASFENGWFTSQTSANKYLSINYLNEKGESEFNFRFSINSHAQDLSLEKISDNELFLYTTIGEFDKEGASGILRLKVTLPEKVNGKRNMSELKIVIDKQIMLKLKNCTPSLSENKHTFALRSGNKIIIANKEDVINNDLSKSKTFNLNKSQLVDSKGEALWFQGIAMKNNKVYCLTGNNKLHSEKFIFVYDTNGKVLQKITIDKKDFIKQLPHKYEPEGITFKGNDLYYMIMAKGKTGGNRKFLFKL